MNKSNIAIVGKKEDVLPFLATGARVCYIKEGGAQRMVEELINQGIKVIFFADEFLGELDGIIKKFQSETFPCLIPFSFGGAKTKLGIERIRGIIKKAAGADIFLDQV
ncbi:MAG: V-type ATP synthase subunit F [candidate division WOR-3 bacterium]